MKPQSKAESWAQWHHSDNLRLCTNTLKVSRISKRLMNKARRATGRKAIAEGKK